LQGNNAILLFIVWSHTRWKRRTVLYFP